MFITFLYILLAIAVLLLLIMVHEFGHYVAGKILKFKIKEFSIGFGKAIFSKTNEKTGEKFSIRIFPLGGYCAFEGEDEEGETEGAFNKQKPWKRLIVLFAGVFFNFVFGVITSVIYLAVCVFGVPKISAITDGNPNAFLAGDIVTAVNGKPIEIYRPFDQMVKDFGENEEFVVTVNRGGEIIDLKVKKVNIKACRYVQTPEKLYGKVYYYDGAIYHLFSDEQLLNHLKNVNASLDRLYKYNAETGEYTLYKASEIGELGGVYEKSAGVSLGILYGLSAKSYSFGEALLKAFPFVFYVCGLILGVLGGLFTGATSVKDVGGTITAVSEIVKISKIDISSLLYLIPLLSINLALFNILPIPALDGARMVFVIIEWIRGKPLNRNVEAYIHFFGLIILFALVIFLDVYHLFFVRV